MSDNYVSLFANESELQEIATATINVKTPISPEHRTSFTAIATNLLKRGFAITPLRGKAPFLDDWNDEKNLITTMEQVQTIVEKYGDNLNAGVVAKATEGGFCIFEIDNKEITTKIEKDTGHNIYMGYCVRSSPERGHIYFLQTPATIALGNISQDAADGKELWSFRANNEQVVGEGSVHPKTGLRYTVLPDYDGDIPPCPDWLVEWMRANKTSKPKPSVSAPRTRTAFVTEGGRNKYLFQAAIEWHKRGVRPETVESELLSLNDEACHPPLGSDEVRTIARSATGYDSGEAVEVYSSAQAMKPTESTEPIANNLSSPISSRLNIVWGNQIENEDYVWLLLNKLPLGELVLIAGNPDAGKGTMCAHLISKVTRGMDFGVADTEVLNPYGKPARVLCLVSEDSIQKDLSPRFAAAKANRDLWGVIDSIEIDGLKEMSAGKRRLVLQQDLGSVKKYLLDHREAMKTNPQLEDIKLLYIDPFDSYCGSIDKNVSKDIRPMFDSLKDLAVEMNIAVVLVAHYSKNLETLAAYRVAGSHAIVAIPRLVFGIGPDKEDEGESVNEEGDDSKVGKDIRLFLPLKANILSPSAKKGIKFVVESVDVPMRDKDGKLKIGQRPAVRVLGTTEKDADTLLAQERTKSKVGGEASGLEKAKTLIMAFLSTDPDSGPKLASDLYDYVSKAGEVHEFVVRNAKRELTTAKKIFNWQGAVPIEDGSFILDGEGNKRPPVYNRWFCSIHPKEYFHEAKQRVWVKS